MINPRSQLHKQNKLSLGEEVVFNRLAKIGNTYDMKCKLFEVDSLLESAMNSQRSAENVSLRVPHASRVSEEDVILCNADSKDDNSVKRDQFSDIQDNGSSFSSQFTINTEESEKYDDAFAGPLNVKDI